MASNNGKKYVIDNERLMKEWDWDKNNELGFHPEELTCGSKRKVWWKCDKGHSWNVAICNRIKSKKITGCPHCYKEKQTSFAEQAIYFYCKKYTNAINRYTEFGKDKEIDIYLPEYNIGIEYNGMYWHRNKEQKDKEKIKYFADKDIRIITVKEGYKNVVSTDTIEHDYSNKQTINFVIESLLGLIGIEYDEINIDKDFNKINEQYIESEKENSIAVKCKDSLAEWNYEKNGNILPTMVSYGSGRKFWWKCKDCSCEWKSTVGKYAGGQRCPKCTKKNVAIKRGKQVRCIDTNIVYCSIAEASRETGVDSNGISRCCMGKQNIAGGYHWEYVDETCRELANKNKREIGEATVKKPVRCIETGIVYSSMRNAYKETGIHANSISRCCNGTHKTAGGYHWEYADDDLKNEVFNFVKYNKVERYHKVKCIETNVVYSSIKDAKDKTGIHRQCISCACRGVTKTAGGYHWEYTDDDLKNKANEYKNVLEQHKKNKNKDIVNKAIRCIETGMIYESIKQAGIKTDIECSNISAVCNGRREIAGGYHWEFVNCEDKKNKKQIMSVRCVETNIIYDSQLGASKETGVNLSSIVRCCHGEQKTAGGYHWEFVEESRRSMDYGVYKTRKKVRCIETGIVYDSITSAANNIGVSTTSIRNACKCESKIIGGYHWEFVKD